MSRRCPNATFLLPDVATHKGRALDGSVPLIPRPMGYNKFVATVRAFAMAPPLAFPWDEAVRVTSYSLRRKLPSMADRLGFPMEARAALGDWRDPVLAEGGAAPQPREPMSVRYSAARLESSVRARLVCMASLHVSSSEATAVPTADPLGSGLAQRLLEEVAQPAWGFPTTDTSTPPPAKCARQQE